MAREWIHPRSGGQIQEDGTEEYIHPRSGGQIQEDQAAVSALTTEFLPNYPDQIFETLETVSYGDSPPDSS